MKAIFTYTDKHNFDTLFTIDIMNNTHKEGHEYSLKSIGITTRRKFFEDVLKRPFVPRIDHKEPIVVFSNYPPVNVHEQNGIIYSERTPEICQSSDVWAFIETNYPNYDSSDDIAYADDLQKIIEGQLNGEAETLFNEVFEKDMNHVMREYNYIHAKIYGEAIENFIKKNEAMAIKENKVKFI